MKKPIKKKKIAKKKLTKEPVVDRLIRELMLLPKKDQLEVVSRGLGVSLDTDNYGQIIIYTDMMYGSRDGSFDCDGNPITEIVPFEVDCLKEHVEYEEEHECEF
jgi:hypothetical protein